MRQHQAGGSAKNSLMICITSTMEIRNNNIHFAHLNKDDWKYDWTVTENKQKRGVSNYITDVNCSSWRMTESIWD